MRIPQIQGLRALAAILVTIFHANLIGGGFVGVDIFYVISGYLITGLILKEISRDNKFRFLAFYARRTKRLLPTSAFILVITAVAAWIILPSTLRQSLGRDVIAASLYVSNYLFAWWETDYQNLGAAPSPVIHFWSLAVEEQFYFIWPLFIYALTRLKSRRMLIIGISFLTTTSLLFSIYQTQRSPIWAFYSLPTRAWELGAGALLFLAPNFKRHKLVPWLGLTFLIFAALAYNESTPFPGKNAILPVLGTVLLIGSVKYWPPVFNDLGNSRISQWLGEISYPLYLWHWPLLILPSTYLARPLSLVEKAICILLTIIFAHLTHIYIERPLRYREFEISEIFKKAGVISATCILLGVAIYFSSSDRLNISGVNGEISLTRIISKPKIYDDGCHVNYGESKSSQCLYGDKNSSRTIVLYGDSHAAQWFPALEVIAERSGFQLISLTKSACPAVDSPRTDKGAFKMADCQQWRKNSTERIRKIKPDILFMSGFQYYAVPKGLGDRQSWWDKGQRKLLNSIDGATSNVIYITDTPHPDRDIPSCLANFEISKCNSSSPSEDLSLSQFKVINPNPWLCQKSCPAVKDGVVVYRDASHITVDIAIALIPRLQAAVARLGVPL